MAGLPAVGAFSVWLSSAFIITEFGAHLHCVRMIRFAQLEIFVFPPRKHSDRNCAIYLSGAQRVLGNDLGSMPIPAAVRAEPELTALHIGGHKPGCRLTRSDRFWLPEAVGKGF